jgi:hypothetical protein
LGDRSEFRLDGLARRIRLAIGLPRGDACEPGLACCLALGAPAVALRLP